MNLTCFTNVPNPYNRQFFAALRGIGLECTVAYDGMPSEFGREWSCVPDDGEFVAGSTTQQYHVAHSLGPGDVAIFSGGYLGKCPLGRRAGLRDEVTSYFWGERLQPRGPFLNGLRRQYLKRFNGVLAIGSWARWSYRMVVARDMPVHVLPYTVSSNRPQRQIADDPTIGFIGSLIPRKGLDLILTALGDLDPRYRPRLEVIGSGPQRDALQLRGDSLGLDIAWHGQQDSEDLEAIQRRWWAQVVPSRYDGWGVVVAEALAAGIPVLASGMVGAAQDLVRPGFNGSIISDGGWVVGLKNYLELERCLTEGRNAKAVARQFSALKAAEWLQELIGAGEAPAERSFIEEGWTELEAQGAPPRIRTPAVILNWERWDLTATAVESARESAVTPVIVDNGSETPITQAQEDVIDGVVVIRNGHNLGFAKGCNAGLSYAFAQGAVFAILVNNDLRITSQNLDLLAEAGLDPAAGLVGGKIYADEGTIWYSGGRLRRFTLSPQVRGWNRSDQGRFDRPGETRFVTGALMGISRQAWEAVGGLPESYFFGTEEWDYSYAVHRAGLRLYYDPRVTAVHPADGSHSNHSPEFVYNGLRNHILLARSLGSDRFYEIWRRAFWVYSRLVLPHRLMRMHPSLLPHQSAAIAELIAADASSRASLEPLTAQTLREVRKTLECKCVTDDGCIGSFGKSLRPRRGR